MTRTVLILGATGRFGRACSAAFSGAGWEVLRFDRSTDSLVQAAIAVGATVLATGSLPVGDAVSVEHRPSSGRKDVHGGAA